MKSQKRYVNHPDNDKLTPQIFLKLGKSNEQIPPPKKKKIVHILAFFENDF